MDARKHLTTSTIDLGEVRDLMTRATGDEKHDESSTSTLDALAVLYGRILRVDPSNPGWPERDRFILSKGHGPVAYYAILAHLGFFPTEWLDDFMEWGSTLGTERWCRASRPPQDRSATACRCPSASRSRSGRAGSWSNGWWCSLATRS